MSYTKNAWIAEDVMDSTLGAQTLAGTPLYQMAGLNVNPRSDGFTIEWEVRPGRYEALYELDARGVTQIEDGAALISYQERYGELGIACVSALRSAVEDAFL
jgi:hypothetical protein